MEAYPESYLQLSIEKTPIHAAAQSNGVQKLDLMCQEYKDRYEKNKGKN
jgi:hypothetical protein